MIRNPSLPAIHEYRADSLASIPGNGLDYLVVSLPGGRRKRHLVGRDAQPLCNVTDNLVPYVPSEWEEDQMCRWCMELFCAGAAVAVVNVNE